MREVNTIIIISNAILFGLWLVFFNQVLSRRFRLSVTMLCEILFGIAWVIPPLLVPYGATLQFVGPLLIVLAMVFLLYKDKLWRILLSVVLVMISMVTSELLLMLLTPEISAEIGVVSLSVGMQIYTYILYLIINAFLLFACGLLLNNYRNRISSREWMLYVLFPVSQFLLLHFWFTLIIWGNLPSITIQILVIAISIAADIALYFAIRGMAQKERLKATNALLEGQIAAQREHYTALTAQYEQIRHMRHDIANHMHTIQILLQNGENAQARDYALELTPQLQFRSCLGSCKNPMVDAFLFSRIQQAEADHIPISTDVVLPDDLHISDVDLISVFGNMLDNAVDACKTADEPHISVRAHVEKGYLNIKVTNTSPAKKEARPQRVQNLERGMGQLILADIAKQYGGAFSTTEQNGEYTASISLQAKGEQHATSSRM